MPLVADLKGTAILKSRSTGLKRRRKGSWKVEESRQDCSAETHLGFETVQNLLTRDPAAVPRTVSISEIATDLYSNEDHNKRWDGCEVCSIAGKIDSGAEMSDARPLSKAWGCGCISKLGHGAFLPESPPRQAVALKRCALARQMVPRRAVQGNLAFSNAEQACNKLVRCCKKVISSKDGQI